MLCDNNGSGADKADARHHTASHTRHIQIVVHIQKQMLAGHCGHGRAQANQDMGPEASRPPFVFPLHSHNASTDHRQHQTQSNGDHRYIPKAIEN